MRWSALYLQRALHSKPLDGRSRRRDLLEHAPTTSPSSNKWLQLSRFRLDLHLIAHLSYYLHLVVNSSGVHLSDIPSEFLLLLILYTPSIFLSGYTELFSLSFESYST